MTRLIDNPRKIREFIIKHYRENPGLGISWAGSGIDHRIGNAEWIAMMNDGILSWGYAGNKSRVCLTKDLEKLNG
jgi:hypothetical protein